MRPLPVPRPAPRTHRLGSLGVRAGAGLGGVAVSGVRGPGTLFPAQGPPGAGPPPVVIPGRAQSQARARALRPRPSGPRPVPGPCPPRLVPHSSQSHRARAQPSPWKTRPTLQCGVGGLSLLTLWPLCIPRANQTFPRVLSPCSSSPFLNTSMPLPTSPAQGPCSESGSPSSSGLAGKGTY
jgi:hypothetical protein